MSLAAEDSERRNFHRSARALPAARGHAGPINRRYDTAGHSLNSRLCRVPDHGGEAVGQLSDGRAAAMSRSFGRKPYGRAAAGSAGPLPQVGGTRRYAAPMAAPAKTGPGPSSVPGILSPRKITVKGAPCGRVYDGGPRHP